MTEVSLPRIGAPIQHPRAAGYNRPILPAVSLSIPALMPKSSRSAKPRPPIILAFGGAEVRFDWQGDRWAHVVRFDGGLGRWTEGWHSVEGPYPGGDDRWPASPVFAELHTHPIAGGIAVMGLGLAGRSHFSVSVAADPAAPGAIRFDIAARIQEPSDRLGSTYRFDGPTATILRVEPLSLVASPLPRTVEWSYRIGPHGIEPLSGARLGA